MKLLDIQHLTIEFREEANKEVVRDISFSMEEGEILGIIGESGSGKTMTALAVMGLLRRGALISDGKLLYKEKDLMKLTRDELRKYQGREIAMIFQEPMTSLNPTMKIGRQVEEALYVHTKCSKEERRKKAYAALRDVDLDPAVVYHKYPHELSGGMRQRVMIAAALILRPGLLIADEPTTALDVGVQAQILELLKRLNRKYRMGILFITHDLRIAENFCENVLIMQKGKILEQGRTEDIFAAPAHPYTKQLLRRYEGTRPSGVKRERKPVVTVENLSVFYQDEQILRDVSFSVYENETLGFVGKSGSGKSTLANTILGFIKPAAGTVTHATKHPQMVFQDPYSSLNPSHTIGWILSEPLKIEKVPKEKRKELVAEALKRVGLSKEHAMRHPSELSGGQRQRVSIALALIGGSKFIVIDEGLSALDVAVQQQVMELLVSLKEEFGLSYLFISHDLDVVERLCDRILLLEDGKITEITDPKAALV